MGVAGPLGRPYGRVARSRVAVSHALVTVAFDEVNRGISAARLLRSSSSGDAGVANEMRGVAAMRRPLMLGSVASSTSADPRAGRLMVNRRLVPSQRGGTGERSTRT